VTGGSSFFTFLGVVVTPPLFHFTLGVTSSYGATYALFGIAPLCVGVALLLTDKSSSMNAVPEGWRAIPRLSRSTR
jgi:hypothetical protein